MSNTPSVIILDRDGVINQDSPDYIKSPEEFILIPGSIEAIAKLKAAGKRVFIATNQSGIGRGLFSIETFFAINQKLDKLLAQQGVNIDGIFFCPHTPEDGCSCRKPLPGLIQKITAAANVEAKDCIFIGDSKRDIEAGLAAGTQVALVKTGNGVEAMGQLEGITAFDSLFEFAVEAVD